MMSSVPCSKSSLDSAISYSCGSATEVCHDFCGIATGNTSRGQSACLPKSKTFLDLILRATSPEMAFIQHEFLCHNPAKLLLAARSGLQFADSLYPFALASR